MPSWTECLPAHERAEYLAALSSTVDRCVDADDFEPLTRLVAGWRATAEVHGEPRLLALLDVEHAGPPVPVVRPLMTGESVS